MIVVDVLHFYTTEFRLRLQAGQHRFFQAVGSRNADSFQGHEPGSLQFVGSATDIFACALRWIDFASLDLGVQVEAPRD